MSHVLEAVVAALVFFIIIVPAIVARFAAVRRGPDKNEVALTIDDGPNASSTPEILAALEAHGVTATFFCVGRKLEEAPVLGRAIADAGHELANHSYGHSKLLAFFTIKRAAGELTRAQAVLTGFGSNSRYFRAVAGVLSPPLYWAAKRVGLVSVHWTATARDGGPVPVSESLALKRLERGLVRGGILVIHDHAEAAKWIGAIKHAADAKGLRFVRLTELLG